MLSQAWFWLFVAYSVFSATCPKTSSIGSLLGLLAMAARIVFLCLLLFTAPHWWWALICLAVSFVIKMMFGGIVTPDNMTPAKEVWSIVGSHLSPIVMLLVYITYF